jgi:hypothetical protein
MKKSKYNPAGVDLEVNFTEFLVIIDDVWDDMRIGNNYHAHWASFPNPNAFWISPRQNFLSQCCLLYIFDCYLIHERV